MNERGTMSWLTAGAAARHTPYPSIRRAGGARCVESSQVACAQFQGIVSEKSRSDSHLVLLLVGTG